MLDDLRRHGAVLIPAYALRARRAAVLVGAAGVPMLFTRFTNDPFSTPKLALLFACVVVAAAALFLEWSQGAFSPNAIGDAWKPAAFFLSPLLVATVLSPYRFWAIFGEYQRYQGFLPYLLVAALGVLVAITFASEFTTPARWLVIAGAVAGGYSALQYVGVDLFQWAQQFGGEAQVTSTIGNTNFSGGFLAVCLPIAAALWWDERGDRRMLVSLVLIAGGVLVSFSQAAWAAAAAGLVFGVGLYLVNRYSWSALVGALGAVVVAVVVAGYVIIGIIRTDPTAGADTVQLRSWWWESAVEMVKDYPVFGHGPNSFAVDSWVYRTPEEASVQGFDYSNDPHSTYLSIATGAGLVGVVGLLAALGWSLSRAWRSKGDLWVAAAGGAIVAYAIDAITMPDELTVRLGLWVSIGLLFAATAEPLERKPEPSVKKTSKKAQARARSPLRRPWAVGLGVLIALAGAGYGIALVVADARFRSGATALREGRVSEGRSALDSSLAVRDDYQYRHTLGFLLGELSFAHKGDRELIEASADAYSYLDSFPDVAGLRDRGRTFYQHSQFNERYLDLSADSYAEAMSLDTFNVTLVSEGGPVLLSAGRYQGIVDLVEPSLELLGSKAPTLYPIVGLAYLELGDRDAAAEMLVQAQQIVPDDPNTLELKKRLATG